MSSHSRPSWKDHSLAYRRPASAATADAGLSFCPICRNWSFGWESKQKQFNTSTITPDLLKVDFYDIAESAYDERCRYCYAIYHAILALGGRIALDGFSMLRIAAEFGKPFYVSWEDAEHGVSCAEVYRLPGKPAP